MTTKAPSRNGKTSKTAAKSAAFEATETFEKNAPLKAAADAAPLIALDFEPLKLELLKLRLEGETPLITHRWSEKAKKAMRDKQTKAAPTAKAARDSNADYDGATYFLDKPHNTRFGFPVIAFKAAMVDAAVAVGAKKTETRRAFRILSDASTDDGEMIEIFSPARSMREDMVRVGMGTADLRYRPEFKVWHCYLVFKYDPTLISPTQIYNLAQKAGFSTGIGEWRTEKDGLNGAFTVNPDYTAMLSAE